MQHVTCARRRRLWFTIGEASATLKRDILIWGRHDQAYWLLSVRSGRGVYLLNRDVGNAVRDFRLQLIRAGIRLALILNKAIGPVP